MEYTRQPKSMSKKRVGSTDLATKSKSYDPIGTNNSFPGDSSLDARSHLARDTGGDAVDLAARRLSDENIGGSCSRRRSCASSAASRVSFVDEEFGLEPSQVVTHIHYRPRTTNNEKRRLFYSDRDFDLFERQELREKIIRTSRYDRQKLKSALLSNQISF